MAGTPRQHRLRFSHTLSQTFCCLYEKVEICKPDMCTFPWVPLQDGEISPISKALGFPLRLRKSNRPEDCNDWSNTNVAMLMLTIDPTKDDWEIAPMVWNRDIGNDVAVRDDGQNLDVRAVEMMCQFARFKMQPMIEQVAEDTCERECEGEDVDVLATKQEVVDWITWDNMVEHWHEAAWKGFDIVD